MRLIALLSCYVILVTEAVTLTHEWTSDGVSARSLSPLARAITHSQQSCKKILWHAPANAGMGSDIHVSEGVKE
jgi:hypothetical protein